MKEKVQNKINEIRKLAKSPVKAGQSKAETLRTNDSLSKAIRNPHEANIFLAELNAAIKTSQKK